MAVFSYLCHIEFLWSLQYRSSGSHEDQNQTDKYHDSDKASNCRNSLKNKQNNTWVDKNFPKETTAHATMFPMSSRSNPALLSKWRPNVQSVDRGSGNTVRKKFFIYLNSSIDEIWFWFQVERMFSSRRVIELACFLSVVIRDTFVFKVTLNSAEMLRRRRRNSSDQVVLKCSIFCCFEEHHHPTAI